MPGLQSIVSKWTKINQDNLVYDREGTPEPQPSAGGGGVAPLVDENGSSIIDPRVTTYAPSPQLSLASGSSLSSFSFAKNGVVLNSGGVVVAGAANQTFATLETTSQSASSTTATPLSPTSSSAMQLQVNEQLLAPPSQRYPLHHFQGQQTAQQISSHHASNLATLDATSMQQQLSSASSRNQLQRPSRHKPGALHSQLESYNQQHATTIPSSNFDSLPPPQAGADAILGRRKATTTMATGIDAVLDPGKPFVEQRNVVGPALLSQSTTQTIPQGSPPATLSGNAAPQPIPSSVASSNSSSMPKSALARSPSSSLWHSARSASSSNKSSSSNSGNPGAATSVTASLEKMMTSALRNGVRPPGDASIGAASIEELNAKAENALRRVDKLAQQNNNPPVKQQQQQPQQSIPIKRRTRDRRCHSPSDHARIMAVKRGSIRSAGNSVFSGSGGSGRDRRSHSPTDHARIMAVKRGSVMSSASSGTGGELDASSGVIQRQQTTQQQTRFAVGSSALGDQLQQPVPVRNTDELDVSRGSMASVKQRQQTRFMRGSSLPSNQQQQQMNLLQRQQLTQQQRQSGLMSGGSVLSSQLNQFHEQQFLERQSLQQQQQLQRSQLLQASQQSGGSSSSLTNHQQQQLNRFLEHDPQLLVRRRQRTPEFLFAGLPSVGNAEDYGGGQHIMQNSQFPNPLHSSQRRETSTGTAITGNLPSMSQGPPSGGSSGSGTAPSGNLFDKSIPETATTFQEEMLPPSMATTADDNDPSLSSLPPKQIRTTRNPLPHCERCAQMESTLLSLQADVEYLRGLDLQREFVCKECENGSVHRSTNNRRIERVDSLPPIDQHTAYNPIGGVSDNSVSSVGSRGSRASSRLQRRNSGTNIGGGGSGSVKSGGRRGGRSNVSRTSLLLRDASKRLNDLSTRHKRQVKQMTHERAYWQNDMHLKLEKFAMMCKNLNEEAAHRSNEVKETKSLLDKMTSERNTLVSQVDTLKTRVELYQEENLQQSNVGEEWEKEKAAILSSIDKAMKDRDEIIADLSSRLELAVETIDNERKQNRVRRQIIFPSRPGTPPGKPPGDNSAPSSPHHRPSVMLSEQTSGVDDLERIQRTKEVATKAQMSLEAAMVQSSARERAMQLRLDAMERDLAEARANRGGSGSIAEEGMSIRQVSSTASL